MEALPPSESDYNSTPHSRPNNDDTLTYDQRFDLMRLFVSPTTESICLRAQSGASYLIRFRRQVTIETKQYAATSPDDPLGTYFIRAAQSVQRESALDERAVWLWVKVGFSIESGCLLVIAYPAPSHSSRDRSLVTSEVAEVLWVKSLP